MHWRCKRDRTSVFLGCPRINLRADIWFRTPSLTRLPREEASRDGRSSAVVSSLLYWRPFAVYFSPQPPGTDRVQPNKANPFRVFTLLKLLHLFLLSLSLSHLAFASDWKQETNGRWGYVLTYPASLIPEPLPTNGAGRRYHSADNEVSLAAFGSHTNTGELNQSLESFWQKELAERATTVTY